MYSSLVSIALIKNVVTKSNLVWWVIPLTPDAEAGGSL